MKKYALVLMTLSLASGCSSSQPSQPMPTLAPQTAPVEAQIAPKDRAKSALFYMDLRLTDGTTSVKSTRLQLAPTAGPATLYRATSDVHVGSMIPSQLEISFPLPPEVATPDQAGIVLLLGCRFGRSGDIYFKDAVPESLTFQNLHGMSRGHFTSSDQVAEAFKFCGDWPMSVAIEWITDRQDILAYEQVYVDAKSTSASDSTQ